MGHAPREQTEKLKEKLLEIRVKNNLSQNGIIKQLGLQNKLIREDISKFERGIREPSLPTLLKYAQFANIYVDVLINDELELPENIPANDKSEGIPAIDKR